MPTSVRSGYLHCSRTTSPTSRTAVYGPVRTVVWQGSAGDCRPYADQVGLCPEAARVSLFDNRATRSLSRAVEVFSEFRMDGGQPGNVWSAAALQAKDENDMVGLRECIRPLCERVLWPLMECAALLSYLVTQAFKPIPGYRFQECRVRPFLPSSWFASKPGRNRKTLLSRRWSAIDAWHLLPGVNCRPLVFKLLQFQSKVEGDRLLLWTAPPRPSAPSCWPAQPPPPECACGR